MDVAHPCVVDEVAREAHQEEEEASVLAVAADSLEVEAEASRHGVEAHLGGEGSEVEDKAKFPLDFLLAFRAICVRISQLAGYTIEKSFTLTTRLFCIVIFVGGGYD